VLIEGLVRAELQRGSVAAAAHVRDGVGARWRLQCDGRAQGGVTGPNKGEAVGLGVHAVSTAEIAAGDAGRADRATTSRNPGLWGSASRR
jgi:hypothetical protein